MTGNTSQTAALPVIGTRVTYRGSLAEFHGRDFLLFPHDVSLSAGDAMNCDCNHNSRYTLVEASSDTRLFHVRSTSFTVQTGDWWPKDALDVVHGGFVYKASHALPGGSPARRILAFYTANGEVLNQLCTLREITGSDTVRILDERGLGLFRDRLTSPSLLSS